MTDRRTRYPGPIAEARDHPHTLVEQGFAEDGYRIVMNCNRDGGQTVYQIHLHLLAGAPLGRFGTPA